MIYVDFQYIQLLTKGLFMAVPTKDRMSAYRQRLRSGNNKQAVHATLSKIVVDIIDDAVGIVGDRGSYHIAAKSAIFVELNFLAAKRHKEFLLKSSIN